ncbi:MAG: ABC transporter permease [Agriterribacter sp.]
MFKNYFKTAFRNLWKNKFFSAINIIGLAIGMSACLVIMVFVFYEKNFDGMHTRNIYRLNEVQKPEGMVEPQKVALSMFPMGPTLKSEFPEIKNFARVRPVKKRDLTYGDKNFFLEDAMWADSTFFQMFGFTLVKGDRATALQQPNSILLTEETAAKIFGKEDPMGKTLMQYIGDTMSFKVTGILKDVPENSHMQFDALYSFNTFIRPEMMDRWGNNWLVTYLELAPGTGMAALEAKFPAYLKKYLATNEMWKYYELFLQPIGEVHGGSTSITHDYLNYQKFDSTYTYLFSIIAIVILVIACINFMNLSTAKSAERAKEVGIRKSIGAHRWQLVGQFLGESILLSLLALLLGILLAHIFLPFVAGLSERKLQLPLFSNPSLLAVVLGITVIVGIVAGLYPAAFLSSFKAVKVLKGGLGTGKNKSLLRNVLVTIQFASAIFLIIATVFAVQQLRFMQQKDPGFVKDQVMVIPLDRVTYPKYDALKADLTNNTLFQAVTASQQMLGNNLHQSGFVFHGDGPARELVSSQVVVDPDYLTLYKIPLIAGRNFSRDYASDNGKAYIINETMAKELLRDKKNGSFESLIGRHFGFGGLDSAGVIVGIAKDFNFNSLHHKIETLSIFNQKDWGYSEMSVRINGAKAKDAIAYIRGLWSKMFPGHPFEYTFLDEHFAELYRADSQVSQVVGMLAVLAIIISCLGLFGLASYAAEKRTKEIGIRKVLGASVQHITTLLSKDFLKLVLISNVLAWPLAWFVINKWLQDFAYRISVNWLVFIAAAAAALLIALLTISFQAIKAAVANPVKSLRTE